MKVLVDRSLHNCIETWIIKHTEGNILHDHVQPASMDIPVGSVCFHVKYAFLPFGDTVDYVANKLQVERFDTRWWVTLYKGQTYLFPCLDIDIPANYFGKISPKSSLWRIDVLIRAVVDHTGMYDTIMPWTAGQLWLQVTPQSFNIRVEAGTPLTQLMLFDQATAAPEYDRSAWFLFDQWKQLAPLFYEDKMVVSIGVWNHETIGYVARYTNEIIDLSKRNFYPWHRFFEEVTQTWWWDWNKITLEKGKFYILPTKEAIAIPPQYSVELVPSSHLVGELRVHYAWFFDPWFGMKQGNTGVLEIRTHENTIVYDGQPICLMQVYTNESLPDKIYGHAGNTYQGQQGARLAKYFV